MQKRYLGLLDRTVALVRPMVGIALNAMAYVPALMSAPSGPQ